MLRTDIQHASVCLHTYRCVLATDAAHVLQEEDSEAFDMLEKIDIAFTAMFTVRCPPLTLLFVVARRCPGRWTVAGRVLGCGEGEGEGEESAVDA
eukprot:115979-Rhodomonas_salina.1